MLYVLTGGSSLERAEKRRHIANSFQELDAGTLSADELASIAGTMTLMNEPQAYVIRGAFASADKKDEEGGEAEEEREHLGDIVLELAEGLAESAHTFVFEEEKMTAKNLAALKKAGAKTEELAKEKKEEPFDVFSIANAMSRRDKKQFWLLLMRALREGVRPENIAGVLAWKARTELSYAKGESRLDAERFSRALVCMYHDSHRGAGDLGLLLERFALTL